MMDQKTTILYTCNDQQEAYALKNRLTNFGIESFLTNQNFTNLMPIYNNMLGGGIQIIVFEKDLEEARNILSDRIEPVSKELVCPVCGSKDIKLGLGKRGRLKIFNIIMALLATIPLGNMQVKYYCKSCDNEFK